MVTLPVWCKCGNVVAFSNETRCEDCFSNDQQRFDGKSRHVDTPFFSATEIAQHDKRADEIKRILKGDTHVLATRKHQRT